MNFVDFVNLVQDNFDPLVQLVQLLAAILDLASGVTIWDFIFAIF